MDAKERFLQVCNVSTTGEEMEKTVLDLLQRNDLQIENVRGQGYDGAANMSGQYQNSKQEYCNTMPINNK